MNSTNSPKSGSRNSSKGFTLLELLIVITIIAILSVVLIVAINPAETLRKARDTQRLADLSSIKTAIGIYTTTKTSPLLDNVDNAACQTTTGTWASGNKIWYSVAATTDTDGLDGSANAQPVVTALADAGGVGGSGWIKVNLSSLIGGSPISNLPIDPVNSLVAAAFTPLGSAARTASTAGAITNAALVYRYACAADNLTFELNAQLESIAFTSATNGEDKPARDGGNNARIYEVGTALTIIGGNDSF